MTNKKNSEEEQLKQLHIELPEEGKDQFQVISNPWVTDSSRWDSIDGGIHVRNQTTATENKSQFHESTKGPFTMTDLGHELLKAPNLRSLVAGN
ncbi:hypothetical protein Nepgr_030498 [Nepenthes gracilis]|uniref:Uncharacterized protein n=1 Tax=Nepenthes gracilis TaxID=150966 RepID=A0AAD3TEQ9_NEPGR|nr:hypothetical protein Nepgr_030498 [Nepenthes gracilis]